MPLYQLRIANCGLERAVRFEHTHQKVTINLRPRWDKGRQWSALPIELRPRKVRNPQSAIRNPQLVVLGAGIEPANLLLFGQALLPTELPKRVQIGGVQGSSPAGGFGGVPQLTNQFYNHFG